jgi:hypothetical protein
VAGFELSTEVMVAIHDGDKLTILRAFDTHQDAREFAVEELRRATRTGEPSES